MKILRGPYSTGSLTKTDERSARILRDNWGPGVPIRFDGTIDDSGERHTEIGIVVDERDAIGLLDGVIKYYKRCTRERDQLERSVLELEMALAKISSLVSSERHRAPDEDELLAAVEEISDHYGHSFNRNEPFRSKFRWLKWRSL